MQVWLTKDDLMVPRQLTQQMEQGYYIFFDVKTWSRQRVSVEVFILPLVCLTNFIVAGIHIIL